MKAYESLESDNLFASGWVKEVKIKLFLNYLLKLLWLLDGSVCNAFPSPFYCSILIRCIVFIGSAKIPELEGSMSPSRFFGNYLSISHKCWPYLPGRWVPFFVPGVPFPQTYTAASRWRNLVYMECLQMIKQMVVGFCWGLMLLWTLVWILRALAQFKGSERSPGLFQDFGDGYIKV